MWLTKQLNKAKDAEAVSTGTVTGTGTVPVVQGRQEYRAAEAVHPYGVASVTPNGEKAVLAGGLCMGTIGRGDTGLNPGEVRLYSKGGAEILLKNSGEVFINGQRFAPKGA